MQTTYEVYENGQLISSTVIEVPDSPPTPEEQTIPDPEPPSDEVPEQVRFDAFAASLDEALSDPQVNSIAEFRAAIRDAIAVGRNVV